jgi:hypothetical protein
MLRLALAGLLVLLSACGSDGGDAHEEAQRRAVVARAGQAIYDYCIDRVRDPETSTRAPAVRAVARLEKEYRSAPNTPFLGRDRNLVRNALETSQSQLEVCDPSLARRITDFLGRAATKPATD